jgi:endonuclease-3 related protein
VKKQGWLHLSLEKSSIDIYRFLESKNLLKDSPPLWWPNAGTFEVVVGAILTQNTTWRNVEYSLKNLKPYLDLDSFLTLDVDQLKLLIKPSGFYNQKSPRLLALATNIKDEFNDFESFKSNVSREWLLSQKGIGQESADAILCYGCMRDEMVVDSYTKRLLKSFSIEFKTYMEYKNFLEIGVREHFLNEKLYKIYAKYHGMIVQYNKLNPNYDINFT